LWLIKVWFSASTYEVKIATFAKPENVIGQCKKPAAQTAHLVFANTQANPKKPKELFFANAPTDDKR
jgi:hypothetical protein